MYGVCSDSTKDLDHFLSLPLMCYLLFFQVVLITFILSLDLFFSQQTFPLRLNIICSELCFILSLCKGIITLKLFDIKPKSSEIGNFVIKANLIRTWHEIDKSSKRGESEGSY